MANDSTNAGVSSSNEDTTPHNENYFTDMQGEDAFFGPEQLAQATEKVVPVPPGDNVVRVQVNPGEIIELSSPFDPGATLLAREGDGNLAIRVGDVTVILQGYVDANQTSPVVIHSSDGQPIDIATLLASTDPTIDIQTAAGPGDAAGAQGQGADNTGALLSQFANGNGLGGLNAVGAQDATQLTYGLIDNSIRLDREDALLSTTTTTTLGFRGLSEPFLRDPFNSTTFSDFTTFFSNYKTDVEGTGDAWADFTGTAANGKDFESYLEQTSFTNVVTHTSDSSEPLYIDTVALAAQLATMKSNQHGLHIDPSTVKPDGTATTVFVRRDGDDALILVIHAHAAGDNLADDTTFSNGDFQIDTYLINRLDHPGQGQDILNLDVPFKIREFIEGQEEQLPVFTEGTVNVPIQDDIPITGETDYYSFLHATNCSDALDCFSKFFGGKITDYVLTNDAGHLDEDYIFHGNKDKDNAFGPDIDEDRGDDIGDKFVVGLLNVNFGADGPSGKIPEGDHPSKADPVFKDADPPALAIAGLKAGDAYPDATSHGHDLTVLKHEKLPFPFSTVEMVQVGYVIKAEPPIDETPSGEGFAKVAVKGDETVVVFTLLLQTGPNLPLFGGFVFEQCQPLDHEVGATLETDLPLNFQVIATDDDGDHPVAPATIAIMVNDDAPYFSITYTNEDPKNCERDESDIGSRSLDGGYGHVDHYTTKDFGHVDEDWLNGGVSNDGQVWANGPGNHDQDGFGNDNANLYGDDKGGLEVCGQIKVKFGADGPSDAANNGALALKVYDDLSDPLNLPLFVNGDGTTLTSDGKPLVVLESGAGHLLVGVAGELIPDGDSEGEPLLTKPQPVFSLDLNPGTGKFEFHLLGAIDHDPVSVKDDDTGEVKPETDLVLSFNVGSAEDFDHDQVLGAINIKVNDDKPEFSVTYCNEVPHNIGDGYVATDYKSDTDFGRIDEDWLRDNPSLKNGSFEDPIVVGNFTTVNGPNGVSGWTVGGAGVDLINDYWSAADGEQSVDLNALNAGTIATVISGLTVGEVYTITFNLGGNPDKDNGPKPISVDVAGVHKDYIVDTTGFTLPNVNWTTQSFTFIATSASETLTFTSGANGPCGPVLDNVRVSSAYIGNQDQDANGNNNANQFGDDYGSSHVSGQVNLKYGADGPGKQSIGLEILTEVKDLHSAGHELTVISSTAGKLEVGYDNVVVFTLTIDVTTGHFDFTQFQPLDHPIASPIEDNLYLSFKVGSITDGDGDTVDAVIKIQVNDDVPETGVTYTSGAEHEPDVDTDFITFGAPLVDYGQIDEDYLATGNKDADNSAPGSPADPVRGDEDGIAFLTGEIGGTTKYGADGPDGTPDHTFALTELAAKAAFRDADGNQLKSHGNLLVVLTSDGDKLDVGYHDANGGPDTVVLTLTMTSDTEFKFQLKEPIDHPQEKGDTVEQSIVLVFGAEDGGAPTDKDQDPAARIVIHVNDDAPLFCEVTYTNYSGPEGTAIPATDPAAAAGVVDEAWAFGGNREDDTRSGDEPGFSHATATITVDFGADGPAEGGGFKFDAYTPGNKFVDAGGHSFTSGGEALVVQICSPTQLIVGLSGLGATFKVELDSTGAVDFHLYGALDHPQGDNIETDLPIVLHVTATDFDGDSVDTQVTFKVNDDAPLTGTVSYSNGDDAGLIDEDFIGDGNFDSDGTAADTDEGGGAAVTGTVTVAFGADGPAEHPYALKTFSVPDLVTPYTDNSGHTFTSKFDNTPLVVLFSTATHLIVGHVSPSIGAVFEVTLDQDTGAFTVTFNQGLDSAKGDDIETSVALAIAVLATDHDGDTSVTPINISVNDDRPTAVDDFNESSAYVGNVLSNDTKGADDAKVTGASSDIAGDQSPDIYGDTTVAGTLGSLLIHADGQWEYKPDPGTAGGTDEFTYSVADGDGDSATATLTITVSPDDVSSFRVAEKSSVYPDDAYGINVQVTKSYDVTTHPDYHDGVNAKIEDTSAGGTFQLQGGHELRGGSGDDLIFGNDGPDQIYGQAGHDAQSGGKGADKFFNVDAADLDGTHTLDGTHSIDGGDGIDTVYLGGLKSFDSIQAGRIENVEILNFKGDPAGAQGTQVTLNYDACYGVTQVGGIHSLTILGDAGKDTVNLAASSGKSWVSDGEFANIQFFHAGSGAEKVTVSVEHGVDVTLS
jgi:choice-of-anchor C domain-containing protein